MQHRDFLKLTVAVNVVSALSLRNRAVFAVSRLTLPIPALLTADARNHTALMIQVGRTQFGALHAITWDYNGLLLGPVLRLAQGRTITVDITNQLAEETALHWRDLEVPGEVDGGPQGVIASGATCTVSSMPTQRVATRRFHPHQHGTTDRQVAMGLAGLVLIEDEESGHLLLPRQWRADDMSVIIQDKKFTAAGGIDYQLDVVSVAVGWLGDTLLASGALYPEHATSQDWLRLRLLNGYNARSLNFAANDKCPLYVVASDGGLSTEPMKVDELPMLMGERFEVLMDTSDGKPFDLVILPMSQMGMTIVSLDKPQPVLHVQPLVIPASGKLLDTLVTLPASPSLTGLVQRQLQSSMDPMLDRMGMQALMERYDDQTMAGMGHGMMGHDDTDDMSNMHHGDMSNMSDMNHEAGWDHGMSSGKGSDFHNANYINDKAFDMNVPMFVAARDQYKRWMVLSKGDMMLYPFHIHGTQFYILSENGKPPAAHRSGWKDTVRVEGDVSEVLVEFNHPALKEFAYVAHCHLLEHEDTRMTLGFTV